MQLSYCVFKKSWYLTGLFCLVHGGAIFCLWQMTALLSIKLCLAAMLLVHLGWVLAHYSLQISKHAIKALGPETAENWYIEYNDKQRIYSKVVGFVPICGMLIIKFLQRDRLFYCLIGYDQLSTEQYRILKTHLYYRRTA